MADNNMWQQNVWGHTNAEPEANPQPSQNVDGVPQQQSTHTTSSSSQVTQGIPQAQVYGGSVPYQTQPLPPLNDTRAPREQAAGVQGGSAYSQQPAYSSGQAVHYTVGTQPAAGASGAQLGVSEQPKSKGWIVALVAVILFFIMIGFGVYSCSAVMTAATAPLESLAGPGDIMYPDNSVAVINISGTIQYDGTTASPEGLRDKLDEAQENPHIKAVVLRVDSGGGTATAGEEMAHYVSDFTKPVVVSSASMNASAAYEISSQADYIFTTKTTAIGAIGTALQVTDVSGLLDKLGINVENITSAESKDSSYGTRELSEEERAYYQDMVDQINETFIETVSIGRGMTTDAVRELATGMTFTGMEAVENGLADEVGYLEDAVNKAAELAGISSFETVYMQNKASDLYDLLGLMSTEKDNDRSAALKEESGVGFER